MNVFSTYICHIKFHFISLIFYFYLQTLVHKFVFDNFLNLLFGFFSTFFQSTHPGYTLSNIFKRAIPSSKFAYKLFINKVYFDEIYNIINIYIFFPLGKFFIKCLDNGLLELFGPRGILKILVLITFYFHLYLDKFLYNYLHIYFFFL